MRTRTKTVLSGKGYRLSSKRNKNGGKVGVIRLIPKEITLNEYADVGKICGHFDIADHGVTSKFEWTVKSVDDAKRLISLAILKGLL